MAQYDVNMGDLSVDDYDVNVQMKLNEGEQNIEDQTNEGQITEVQGSTSELDKLCLRSSRPQRRSWLHPTPQGGCHLKRSTFVIQRNIASGSRVCMSSSQRTALWS